MTIPFSATLGREDLVGAVLRAVVLSLVLAVGLAVSFWVKNAFAIDMPNRFLLAVFFVVLFSMVGGLILSEYPQGNDYALMRVGFATFCRTGLPLVVVMLVARYSDPAFAGKTSLAFLTVFYAVGLLTGIRLSFYRYSVTNSSSKSQEVDSAAA